LSIRGPLGNELANCDKLPFYLKGKDSRILKKKDPMEKVSIWGVACAKVTIVTLPRIDPMGKGIPMFLWPIG